MDQIQGIVVLSLDEMIINNFSKKNKFHGSNRMCSSHVILDQVTRSQVIHTITTGIHYTNKLVCIEVIATEIQFSVIGSAPCYIDLVLEIITQRLPKSTVQRTNYAHAMNV